MEGARGQGSSENRCDSECMERGRVGLGSWDGSRVEQRKVRKMIIMTVRTNRRFVCYSSYHDWNKQCLSSWGNL